MSATEPIGIAFERMRRILFEPFDAGKWFVLGFCAFLAALGQSGGANFRLPGGGGGNGGAFPPSASSWVGAHVAIVIAIGAAVFLVVIALWLVLCWLSSRGKFMFIDGVVRNRGAVSEPWARFADVAWRLFTFRVAVGVIAILVLGALAAVGALLLWPTFQAVSQNSLPPQRLILMFVAVGSVAFLAMLPFLVIHLLLELFLVPIMYVRGGGVGDAWAEFRARLMPQLGSVILFVILYFLLSIGAALIAFVATCLTCCLAAIPYVGTVILLPLPVFFRCYSLEFVAQLGGDYERLRGGVDVGGTFD